MLLQRQSTRCVSPCRSSFSLVLFDIFVNILAHNLAEPAYEADVAQLEYKLVAGEHGLVIRLKGFNHKLPVRTHTLTHTHTLTVLYNCENIRLFYHYNRLCVTYVVTGKVQICPVTHVVEIKVLLSYSRNTQVKYNYLNIVLE